jgi:hypothetical protein
LELSGTATNGTKLVLNKCSGRPQQKWNRAAY